jgi:hypothetical protein
VKVLARIRPIVAMAILLVVGVGVWAGLRRPEEPVADAQLDAIAHELEGKVHEATAAVHARALTLAEIPRLGLLVYTDAPTAQDLTREELSFAPHEAETIEVRQLAAAGQPTRVLLRVPLASAAVAVPDAAGVYLRADARHLTVSEVLPIGANRLHEHEGDVGGALVVSRNFLLRVPSLRGACCAAWIDVGGATLPLGERPRVAGRATVRRSIGSFAGMALALEVQVPPSPSRWPWLLVALAGLLLAWSLVLQRRHSRHAQHDTTASSTPPSIALVTVASDDSVARSAATELGDGSESTLDTPHEARRVGRYSIVRKIASGGIADVFLARAHGPASFQKEIALKVLKPQLAPQKVIVDHFVAEARVASQLAHPNIIEITDLGVGDEYFIAMELVDGADLRRLLEAARARGELVPLPIALQLLRAICDGLHAAHVACGRDGASLQIVHRDVKPGNVLVGRNGVVKVGDFGIAHAADAFRVYVTEIGEVKGTTAYMAPEQRLGQNIDRRVDVYGVGALAYQLLTNARINLDIVRVGELGEVGWPHLPPLDDLRPELPPELSRIVLGALSYHPYDRFSSCDTLERAFGEVALRDGLTATSKTIGAWVTRLLDGGLPSAEASATPLLPEVPRERVG